MRVSDQPERVFAVFVLAPVLYLWKHLLQRDPVRHATWIAPLLGHLSVGFACYELFWLYAYPPKVTCATPSQKKQ